MKIQYAENPLASKIILSDAEKKELWYRIKIDEMQNRVYSAMFSLEEGQYFDIKRARHQLDENYWFPDKDDEKSKLDQRVDTLFEHYITSLEEGWHIGDCVCVPCSCSKCHAESLIGVDTMNGIYKHPASNILSVFDSTTHDGKPRAHLKDDATCQEMIDHLKANPPKVTEGWEQYHERWITEHELTIDWLERYQRDKLGKEIEVELQ